MFVDVRVTCAIVHVVENRQPLVRCSKTVNGAECAPFWTVDLSGRPSSLSFSRGASTPGGEFGGRLPVFVPGEEDRTLLPDGPGVAGLEALPGEEDR